MGTVNGAHFPAGVDMGACKPHGVETSVEGSPSSRPSPPGEGEGTSGLVKSGVFAGLIDVPMGVMGADVKELAGLAQGLAVQLAATRKERDLWQSMHRNQCGVNEPLHQLVADQRELIEELRVQVNQFERLLGMIPCTGDFDRACAWVTSVTANGGNSTGCNESHCVAIWERFPMQEMTILFCDNCKVEVARLSDEEALLQGFRNADSYHEYWNAAFKKHTAPKEPALKPPPVVNPNAGQVQAYPKGRWASKEEGGA